MLSSLDSEKDPNREARRYALIEVQATAVPWNVVRGTVLSVHHGLTHTGYRVQLRDGGVLKARSRSNPGHQNIWRVGEELIAKIAPTAIILSVPGQCTVHDRWNQWEGRIVLVQTVATDSIITVKVLGEGTTLKTRTTVIGLDRVPRAWDVVRIHIDPRNVVLRRPYPAGPLRPRLISAME